MEIKTTLINCSSLTYKDDYETIFVVNMLSTFHSRTMIVHADMSATGLDVEEVSCDSKTPKSPKSRTHFCIYQNVAVHICINIRLSSVEKLKEGLLTDPYKTYQTLRR